VTNVSSFDQSLQGGMVVPYQPTHHSVIHHQLRIVLGLGESKLGNQSAVQVYVGIYYVFQTWIDNNLKSTSRWNNSCVHVTIAINEKRVLDSKHEGDTKTRLPPVLRNSLIMK
jgi:hypothetical protein